MPRSAATNELPVSVALLGALAAVLSGLAIILGTGTLEWPVDLYFSLAILVLAAVLGAMLSVVLENAKDAWEPE